MITNTTKTSFMLNDQLVDLNVIHTKVQLLGNGATIHKANGLFALLSFVPICIERGYDYQLDEEKLLKWYTELRLILRGL